jgi:DNA mismatch repair protein MutS
MAIARAVLEYCADRKKLGAKTMFATHYHELSSLEGEIEGVRNYNISAKKQGGTLVFLRKIIRGAADDSYGIEVAKLAGLPDAVVNKAKAYLKELEEQGMSSLPEHQEAGSGQISFADVGVDEVRRILDATDLNTLTPLEAMNLLCDLQKKARA